jgi:hypothetical protein
MVAAVVVFDVQLQFSTTFEPIVAFAKERNGTPQRFIFPVKADPEFDRTVPESFNNAQ